MFPGEPETQPLQSGETGRMGIIVGYGVDDPDSTVYIARAEDRDKAIDLRSALFGYLGGVTTEQVGASSYELDGLPAVRADFTTADHLKGTTILANDGLELYQVIAVGGAEKDREAFFDSFESLG